MDWTRTRPVTDWTRPRIGHGLPVAGDIGAAIRGFTLKSAASRHFLTASTTALSTGNTPDPKSDQSHPR
jgi:hypothetical protein